MSDQADYYRYFRDSSGEQLEQQPSSSRGTNDIRRRRNASDYPQSNFGNTYVYGEEETDAEGSCDENGFVVLKHPIHNVKSSTGRRKRPKKAKSPAGTSREAERSGVPTSYGPRSTSHPHERDAGMQNTTHPHTTEYSMYGIYQGQPGHTTGYEPDHYSPQGYESQGSDRHDTDPHFYYHGSQTGQMLSEAYSSNEGQGPTFVPETRDLQYSDIVDVPDSDEQATWYGGQLLRPPIGKENIESWERATGGA